MILFISLNNLLQIIEPVDYWFHFNPQGAYSLAAHWCTELTNLHYAIIALTVPYIYGMKRLWDELAQDPHYDRFSQDSNPCSSDHWFGQLCHSGHTCEFAFVRIESVIWVVGAPSPCTSCIAVIRSCARCTHHYTTHRWPGADTLNNNTFTCKCQLQHFR